MEEEEKLKVLYISPYLDYSGFGFRYFFTKYLLFFSVFFSI